MNVIIFIPGYKGSKLKYGNNNKLIFPHWKNLFVQSPLELDISGKQENPIVPAGILDEIAMMGLKIDIYKSFIDNMQGMGGSFKLITFDYDWRLDIMEHIKRLDSLIQNIKSRYDNVHFVCHSLGAYLLAYYLKYGTQEPEGAIAQWSTGREINKIVFIAIPFKGAQALFKDLHYSDGYLWNKKLFHKNMSRSFPAAYQLLPHYEKAVLDENGKTIDLGDVHNWKKNNFVYWGEKPENTDYLRVYELFLEKQLKKSWCIYENINKTGTYVPDNCKILNLIGMGQPTLKQCIWVNSKKRSKLLIKKNEYLNTPFIKNPDYTGDGDGLILSEAAKLPDCYKNKYATEIYECCGHADFFKKSNISNLIIDFLKA